MGILAIVRKRITIIAS